jgi:DNA-binding transcriptional LysR family regulator
LDATTRQLRCFVVLAEELNFTRAAARLFVAQQALSATLRQLEARVGVTLVERSTRHVALTGAGRMFLEEARTALAAFDRGVGRARQAAGGQPDTLRLGTLLVGAVEVSALVLDQFREDHEDVRVAVTEYRYDDPSAGLADGSVDVALLRPPLGTPGIDLLELFQEPRVLVVSSRHRLAARRRVSIDEILDEPVVVARCTDPVWHDFWLLNAERGHPPVSVWAEVSSAFEALEMVRSGRACTNVPLSYASQMRSAGLRFIPISGLAQSACAVAWRRGDDNRPVTDFVASARHVRDRTAAPSTTFQL